MKVLIFSFVFLVNFAHAAELEISVLEVSKEQTNHWSFDTAKSVLKPLKTTTGKALQQTTTYSLRDGKVYRGEKKVSSATEILYQCRIDGCDLLVVRDEHNSFSNPMRILSAAAGHPIQVSKIVIFKIVDGKLKTKAEIVRKPSSYQWKVAVHEKTA